MTLSEYRAGMGELLLRLDVRNFVPDELARPGARRASAVLEVPPESLWANMIPTIVRVEAVRRELDTPIWIATPVHPGRGYRSSAYNRVVGGAPESLHVEFNALDLVPSEAPTQKLYDALCALPGADEMFGIGRYADRGFVHFDTRGLIRPRAQPWRRAA